MNIGNQVSNVGKSFFMVLRPHHLGALPPDATPEAMTNGLKLEDLPRYYVFMDGKPSDAYKCGGRYCLASLAASNFNVLTTLGAELDTKLSKKGFKFRKLSKIRKKKRREKYIVSVLDILIDISKQRRGLPFNYLIAMGSMEFMNPDRFLTYFRANREFSEIFSATILDEHIQFIHDGNQIKMHHNEFGAMMWWHTMLLNTSKWVNADKNFSWWVHLDRLPSDRNLHRTRFFAAFLDFMFKGKLWISISGDVEMPADLFPDFFANMYYDLQFAESSFEQTIRQKMVALDTLNTKKYWDGQIETASGEG